MPLLWLPEADADVHRLFRFLLERNPVAAENVVVAIRSAADDLHDFPEIGRPLSDGTGDREHVVPFGIGRYVLRYRITNETVVVIRVWHSREAR